MFLLLIFVSLVFLFYQCFQEVKVQRDESSTDGPASPSPGPGAGRSGNNYGRTGQRAESGGGGGVLYAELANTSSGNNANRADSAEIEYASLEVHAAVSESRMILFQQPL